MATPRPLEEVAAELGMARSTLWKFLKDKPVTKFRMPGKGKTTYLDLDEVRRLLKPVPVQPKPER